MASIFRDSVLDQLSSPEKLDRMIPVVSSSFWISMIGCGAAILAVLIWACVGEIPENIKSSGIYTKNTNVYSVYAQSTGIISEINVAVGDHVTENQQVAVIEDQDTASVLKDYNERKAKLSDITMDSTDDISNSDTQNLINIKSQIGQLANQLSLDNTSLSSWEEQYNAKLDETSKLKEAMDNAKASYIASLQGTDNSVQLDYSEKQTDYKTKLSYYKSAQSSYLNSLTSYKKIIDSVRTMLNTNAAVLESVKTETGIDDPVGTLNEAGQAISDAISNLDDNINNLGIAVYSGEVPDIMTAFDNACARIASAAGSAYTDSVEPSAASTWSTLVGYASQLYQTTVDLNDAESVYNDALAAYENTLQSQTDLSVEQQKLSTEYSVASTNYNTANSTLLSLKSQVQSIKAQIEADQMNYDTQKALLQQQFQDTKEADIATIDAAIAEAQRTLEKSTIAASKSGTVTEIVASEGALAATGTELVRIADDSSSVESNIILFVSLSKGKKITEGMTVKIHPTTYDEQEYGHMEGTVTYVDSFSSSSSSINSILGNETLTSYFTKSGPVMSVYCNIRKDSNTVSGFWWSSRKGADIAVSNDTILSAEIVTDTKHPIEMVIPLLKSIFNGSDEEEAAG
ncbi:MAG TPA: NHLP bacteriocin system secretion protein [Lachnospiraceae bacterium]|nr:NHLP bacteriocin system secretion protein [Lachnospiraceae bacterium]